MEFIQDRGKNYVFDLIKLLFAALAYTGASNKEQCGLVA